MDQSRHSVSEYSEDYPLGGSVEPYDIWRDMEMGKISPYFARFMENKTPTSMKRQMSQVSYTQPRLIRKATS